MKRYTVLFEWRLGGFEQENTLTVWASSDVSALNIARTKLLAFAKSTTASYAIDQEVVKESP